MMDGSLQEDGKTPADYDYNVKVTAEVVKLAHAKEAYRSKVKSAAWARSNMVVANKKMVTAQRNSLARSIADRSR